MFEKRHYEALARAVGAVPVHELVNGPVISLERLLLALSELFEGDNEGFDPTRFSEAVQAAQEQAFEKRVREWRVQHNHIGAAA